MTAKMTSELFLLSEASAHRLASSSGSAAPEVNEQRHLVKARDAYVCCVRVFVEAKFLAHVVAMLIVVSDWRAGGWKE